MLFAYVTVDGPTPGSTEEGPSIVLDAVQHAALLAEGCDALAILADDLAAEDCDPGIIVCIDVETGADADARGLPDAADPDTRVTYARAAPEVS